MKEKGKALLLECCNLEGKWMGCEGAVGTDSCCGQEWWGRETVSFPFMPCRGGPLGLRPEEKPLNVWGVSVSYGLGALL